MKVLELAKNLTKPKSVYLICGEDAFLARLALTTLKNALVPNFSDINLVNVDANIDAQTLFEMLQAYPFGDEYRLIVINDFKPKKPTSKSGGDLSNVIATHAKAGSSQSIIVLYAPGEDVAKDFLGAEIVDASHLSAYELGQWINNEIKSRGAKITPCAVNKLIEFTLLDLSRISTELNKLIDYKSGGEITEKDVELFVAKDKEYQVFEIQDKIAKGDSVAVFDIIETIMRNEKNAFSIITPLYNNYRRALFVSLHKQESDEELARLLQIKPYAVKMLRPQVAMFSPKKLKKISSMLYALDNDIKNGRINENIGLIKTISNILLIRKEG